MSASAIYFTKSKIAYQLNNVTSKYNFTGGGYTINNYNIAYFDINKGYGPLTIVAIGSQGKPAHVQYIDNDGVIQTKLILKDGF
ncbi:hypothetical protein [Pedobacter sp. NJ-S-72]